MALLRSVVRRRVSLLVELALLSPVVAMLILGGLEICRMKAVEAALASTASEIATAGVDSSRASDHRRGLSRALNIREDDIVVVAEAAGDRVTVSVPCSKAGATLASVWSGARISGTSKRCN